MNIRPAKAEDASAIAEIWNHYINGTIVTFNPIQKSSGDIELLLEQKERAAQAFLLIEADKNIVGFATYGSFRTGQGYARVAEHTIMLHPDRIGSGAGTKLMKALYAVAKDNEIHSLFAGISGENEAAIAFHKRQGFEHISTIPEIGWKFDRWHDLVLMRKHL